MPLHHRILVWCFALTLQSLHFWMIILILNFYLFCVATTSQLSQWLNLLYVYRFTKLTCDGFVWNEQGGVSSSVYGSCLLSCQALYVQQRISRAYSPSIKTSKTAQWMYQWGLAPPKVLIDGALIPPATPRGTVLIYKAKWQYLLTCKVSGYCLLAVDGRVCRHGNEPLDAF